MQSTRVREVRKPQMPPWALVGPQSLHSENPLMPCAADLLTSARFWPVAEMPTGYNATENARVRYRPEADFQLFQRRPLRSGYMSNC